MAKLFGSAAFAWLFLVYLAQVIDVMGQVVRTYKYNNHIMVEYLRAGGLVWYIFG